MKDVKHFGPGPNGGLEVSPSILDSPGYRKQINAAKKHFERPCVFKETTEETAARLRGEAAPEGQAVKGVVGPDARERIACSTAAPAPVAGDAVRDTLQWYAEHVGGCRKIGGDGDKARQALDADGGKRAVAALAQDRASQEAAPVLMSSEGDWTVMDCPKYGECVKYSKKGADGKAAYRDLSAECASLRAQLGASQAGAAGGVVTEDVRNVIEMLIDVAYCADVATEDSENLGDGEGHIVGDRECADLSAAIEALEELPDDQPGYVMGAAAKARWALRGLLGVAPTPAAERENGHG